MGWVMEGVRGGGEDDVGEGMQCSDHPYRNNPGGICAFCLQEKLGKLVSSSFPNAIFPSSSSSSPSFRSEIGGGAGAGVGVGGGGGGASSTSLSVRPTSSSSSYSASKDCHYHGNYSRRARIPFLLAQKKKKKKEVMGSDAVGIVLKRSKSTTTPRRGHFLVESEDANDYSPQKRGFWSFLYLPKSTATRKMDKAVGSAVTPRESKLAAAITQTHASLSHKPKDKGLGSSSLAKKEEFVDESESPNSHATASSSSFGRKVSRSRSVGCGSRSFSGDFFERISTGFGDCTLRRVESQREGKPKSSGAHRGGAPGGPDHQCIKERVKCGGIFGGFIMTSSSSSSSSSSYWMSSTVEDNVNGKSTAAAAPGPLSHGRSKSWGWAFASPMRALSKPSSSKVEYKDAGKRDITPNKPNLAAIPSLLAVRG